MTDSLCIIMVFFRVMVLSRWTYDHDKHVMTLAGWSKLKILIAKYLCEKQVYQQGLGRHTHNEILAFLHKDLTSLAEVLGTLNGFEALAESIFENNIFYNHRKSISQHHILKTISSKEYIFFTQIVKISAI